MRSILPWSAALLALSCANGPPPAPPSSSAVPVTTVAAPASAASSAASAPAPVADLDAGAAPDASAFQPPPIPPPVVADNKVAPVPDDADLEQRTKALLDAIMSDDPSRAESFWFPKEPFLVLKDIKDPGKYWGELHHAYERDIHELHKKRKSWDGCKLARLEHGSTPKWVKPGEEANKIGYYRSFRWQLHYTTPDGADEELELHVVITWQGRWFITHLRKFK